MRGGTNAHRHRRHNHNRNNSRHLRYDGCQRGGDMMDLYQYCDKNSLFDRGLPPEEEDPITEEYDYMRDRELEDD